MRFEVHHPGSYAMVQASLEKGEALRAESGAMVAMSPTIDVEGKMQGGLWSALKRKALGGESFFLQTLKASRGPGDVFFAPSTPGAVTILDVTPANPWFVQKDGFLASEEGVTLDVASQGLFKGLFSGEGVFIQKASGSGRMVVSSFGAIHRKELAPQEAFVVDNGHLVAWSASVHMDIRKASTGIISSMTSGEGLVCVLTGPGEVYFQTRNAESFAAWIAGMIPARGE